MRRQFSVCLLITALLFGNLKQSWADTMLPRIVLTQQERDWIKEHPTLRVGVFKDLLPFEYLSGDQLRGLSSKYLSFVSRRTGLSFIFVPTTTRSDRKDMLLKGEIDILALQRKADNSNEDQGILYTTPYDTSSTILVTRVGDHGIDDLELLANKTLVMLKSEEYSAFLSAHASGVKIITADNGIDMLAMVKDGRADAAIASEWLLIPYLPRNYEGILQVSGDVPQLHTGVSMAIRDDNALLFSILQKVLASLNVNERKAIYDSWFSEMELDIPSIGAIAEHFEAELWMLLVSILLLLLLVSQSRQQRRRAMHNEREKAMFLAMMSHEIRSPMNAVLAAVELLEHTPLDDQQRHLIALSKDGASTLLRLLDDVLDISKLEAGQLKLNLDRVDPLALVQEVVSELQLRAIEKGLAIKVLGEQIIAPLLLDDARLTQVMRNLISNAIKFTESGQVLVEVQVFEETSPPSRQLRIKVIDSGIGMSKQTLASLFRPYDQTKLPDKRVGGTSLGLLLCRELVRLMKGQLSFSSKLGQGTAVELLISVELAPVFESPMEEEPDPAGATATGPAVRTLVVDNTLASQHVLQGQIEGFGGEVLLAENAAQGLALFAENQVGLVLMDCDLPDLDALSLAADFRNLERHLKRTYCPIIAMSTQTGNQYLERYFDAGMDGVLNKPIRLTKLQEILELWCEIIVAQPPPLIPITREHSIEHEAVRNDLAQLVEAVALRDTQRALRAVRGVCEVALILEWKDMVELTEIIEQLLNDPVAWSATGITQNIKALVDCWYGSYGNSGPRI